jgi:hypothetical protein
MQTLVQFIESKSEFKSRPVSREEREDGIGVAVGMNYCKRTAGENFDRFYTEAEALTELGFELKFSTGKLQARNEVDAKAQAVKIAEKSGVKAIEVKATQFGSSNAYNIATRYIK